MLVRRPDAAGDAQGAEIARTLSDRLRAICGDLHLPIRDDFGVNPALEWLVVRIERLAGGGVRLEHAYGTRPPADVELAFFWGAKEASERSEARAAADRRALPLVYGRGLAVHRRPKPAD